METIKMANRIGTLFSNKKNGVLSVFFTAGFPKLDDTIRIAQELEKAGADLIEIGIPFSDPVADGPTIQHSNKVALRNGMSLNVLFQQVEVIRKTVSLPIVLMGYFNPVFRFGIERFVSECKRTGIDGVILPDLPAEEYRAKYKILFEDHSVGCSFLITPTTSPERIRLLDDLSTGFIYAVSASSTTGVKELFYSEQLNYFESLTAMNLRNPILIGFGISTPETFRQACRYGAGAIVGSAFIKALEKNECRVAEFIAGLKGDTKSPG